MRLANIITFKVHYNNTAPIRKNPMIHALTGLVNLRKKQMITLCADPVVLEIMVPDETVFKEGMRQTVYLYLHWNQEQGPSLYGFFKEFDKTVFLMIIDCSGIGPRIGLAVLADLGAQSFLEAIHTGNEKLLSKVSGIGAKKAEQMMVQLKHKVQHLIQTGIPFDGAGDFSQWNTVIEALAALNYSRTEITQAMNFVRKNGPESGVKFDQIMRQALSFLSKHA